jgi:hypothetical protein
VPTDVSAPLPALQVDPGTIYTVTCDDANAVITQLVVHGEQEAGPDLTTLIPGATFLLPVES